MEPKPRPLEFHRLVVEPVVQVDLVEPGTHETEVLGCFVHARHHAGEDARSHRLNGVENERIVVLMRGGITTTGDDLPRQRAGFERNRSLAGHVVPRRLRPGILALLVAIERIDGIGLTLPRMQRLVTTIERMCGVLTHVQVIEVVERRSVVNAGAAHQRGVAPFHRGTFVQLGIEERAGREKRAHP